MSLQTWQETLVTAHSDGPAITSDTRASALPSHALYTLKPNFFDTVGKQLLVRASGRISSVITLPGTARFDINFRDTGAVDAIVFDSLAILLEPGEAHIDVGWTLDVLLTCRAVGTAATLMGQGVWTSTAVKGQFNFGALPVGAVPAILPWDSAPDVGASFDSTLSQQVDLRFTQTVGTGSMTVHQYSLVSLN